MSEIDANLSRFIQELSPMYLKNAMVDACAVVQETAKEKCPKDTGALRRSIDFDTETSSTSVNGRIYSNLEYAPYVELGTGIYAGGRQTPWVYKGSKGFFTTKGSPPQPFLEPAIQVNTSRILDCFKELF